MRVRLPLRAPSTQGDVVQEQHCGLSRRGSRCESGRPCQEKLEVGSLKLEEPQSPASNIKLQASSSKLQASGSSCPRTLYQMSTGLLSRGTRRDSWRGHQTHSRASQAHGCPVEGRSRGLSGGGKSFFSRSRGAISRRRRLKSGRFGGASPPGTTTTRAARPPSLGASSSTRAASPPSLGASTDSWRNGRRAALRTRILWVRIPPSPPRTPGSSSSRMPRSHRGDGGAIPSPGTRIPTETWGGSAPPVSGTGTGPVRARGLRRGPRGCCLEAPTKLPPTACSHFLLVWYNGDA